MIAIVQVMGLPVVHLHASCQSTVELIKSIIVTVLLSLWHGCVTWVCQCEYHYPMTLCIALCASVYSSYFVKCVDIYY